MERNTRKRRIGAVSSREGGRISGTRFGKGEIRAAVVVIDFGITIVLFLLRV